LRNALWRSDAAFIFANGEQSGLLTGITTQPPLQKVI